MDKKEKLELFINEMKSYKKNIFDFNRDNVETDFVRHDPFENGVYLTIRVGLSGIYQVINMWKDGHWIERTCDNSITIARSRNKIDIKALR
ncbi:MAG: hypothetical protein IKT40_09525 [Bacilli bacterium]|nr:hypothetical protein [Bacilli bacterium]